eukprot:TRINITY_DN1128_c0_g14_i1.p1 TRINITY_DN1128_c0_g14~~TRINITY_DN1128_c0_g14_i1.p1  ORF type:complete len:305 (-),score=88.67 TRINITY_DN1128_c0_g14_i1:883-1797(-)
MFPTKFPLNDGGSIPSICLGTSGPKESLKELVRIAVNDYGYRGIDTARKYDNEEFIGEALQSILKEGKVKREELFVITKIHNDEKGKGEIEGKLRDSLKKLQLDYVDLLLIHWPIGATIEETKKIVQTPLYQTWAEFEDCRNKGLCKHIGVSNFGVQLLLDMFSYSKIRPAVNQIELHPYLTQEDLVRFCQEQGIVVQAYSPIASMGTIDWRPFKGNLLEDEVLKELAEKYKKTPAQIALNWGIKRNYVITPKTEKKERLGENMAAGSFVMEEADYEKIFKLNKNIRCFDLKFLDNCLNIPIFS